jgi:hypothetical protein
MLTPGTATVAFTTEGTYIYWANTSISHIEVSRGEVNDPDNIIFPELAESIDDCKAPVLDEITIPARGILGILGIKTEKMATDGICPALAVNFDFRTAETVIQYFNRPLP